VFCKKDFSFFFPQGGGEVQTQAAVMANVARYDCKRGT